MNKEQEEELTRRMAQTVRLGLCVHQNLQSPETYTKIADRLIKDVRYVLYGEYITTYSIDTTEKI